MIFVLRMNDALESSSCPRRSDWLNVSALVCRKWRQITLDTPSLWSYIDFANLEFAETMLCRAKAVPISLKIVVPDTSDLDEEDSDDNGSDLGELAMKTISGKHLRELDIESSVWAEILRLLVHRPGLSARFLRRLKLTCRDPDMDDFVLPAKWLWYDMPSLRHLELIDVPPPTHFDKASNLVFLKIHTSQLISVEETLDLLHHIPRVEELSVALIYSGERHPAQWCAKGVSLPNLRSLELRALDVLSASIFHFLEFPASASVSLSFDTHPISHASEYSFFNIVDVWSRFAQCHTQPELSAEFSSHHLYESFILSIFKGASVEKEQKPVLQLECPFPLGYSIFPIIKTISSRVRALTLVELDARGNTWRTLFSHFPDIQRVTFKKCDLRILDFLLPPRSARQSILWPKLTDLIISHYEARDGAHITSQPTPRGHFGSLLGLLKARPIQNVKVSETTTTDGVIDQFREDQVRIHWENVRVIRKNALDVGDDCDNNDDEESS
ncbi:hypothetical protein ONZ45_g5747 [Pleurotus djamor]|nr:hypothetical protein ONZ45_g5747 [Pleurotus djamor]